MAWESLIEIKEDEPLIEVAKPKPAEPKPAPAEAPVRRPPWVWPAIIAASVLGVLALGTIIYVANDKGRINIVVDGPTRIVTKQLRIEHKPKVSNRADTNRQTAAPTETASSGTAESPATFPDLPPMPRPPVAEQPAEHEVARSQSRETETKSAVPVESVAQKPIPAPDAQHPTGPPVAPKQEVSSRTPDRGTAAEQKVATVSAPTLEPHLVRELRGHKKDVLRVAFSPDGRLLASGGEEPDLIVWDPATGQDLWHLKREALIRGLTFASVGHLLVSGRTGWTPGVTIQNLDNGDIVEIGTRSAWKFLSVAIHGSSQFLAAGDDKTLRVWDLNPERAQVRKEGDQDHTELFEFNPPPALPDEILCLAFHPNQRKRYLAVGCRSGDVKLIQIGNMSPNGIQPAAIKIAGHQGPVHCVKFHPDGAFSPRLGKTAPFACGMTRERWPE